MPDRPISKLIPFGRGRLSNDFLGFTHIAKLHHDLNEHKGISAAVDLRNVTWFDAHLSAPLRVVVEQARLVGTNVRFVNVPERIRIVLCKNRFLIEEKFDNFGTTMPVQCFNIDNGVDFSKYAKRNIDRKEFPRMTESLKSKFFEGIDEIFANCSLHSKTRTSIVASGQFFPNVNRLDFALADGGLGIRKVILQSLEIDIPSHKAIEWAMTPNNTTRKGDIPGGLGSKILRDFIEINRGRLFVVSEDGLWTQQGSHVSSEKLAFSFPGTFVILEIDTSDRRSYDLASAPDPRDIW